MLTSARLTDGDFFDSLSSESFIEKDLAWSPEGISKLHLLRMSLTLVSTLIWCGLKQFEQQPNQNSQAEYFQGSGQ
jgi:hypothetical protein